MDGTDIPTGSMDAFVCVISGAVGGLIIGLVTEYYTSHSYAPVREVSVFVTYLVQPIAWWTRGHTQLGVTVEVLPREIYILGIFFCISP